MITFEDNNTGGDDIDVDVVCEDDEGVFLSLSGKRDEDMSDVFDLTLTDQSEIRAFFDEVERARQNFVRLSEAKAQRGTIPPSGKRKR